MCTIDLDPCAVWRETKRTARKEHWCSCCRGRIAAGTIYTVHFSVYDGNATSQKICEPCRVAREEFGGEHDATPIPSYFPELLNECIADGDEESERRWKPMAEAIRDRGVPGASEVSRS